MNKRFFAFSIFILMIGLLSLGCGGGGGGSNPVASPAVSTANLTGLVKLNDVPMANAKVFLSHLMTLILPAFLNWLQLRPAFSPKP